ncbi:AAA family ATPase [Microbispora rosea]|uniref:McrB family protein n=1 Tax=Microbispora rosea TaxID=58117 RepID=UPI003449DA5D
MTEHIIHYEGRDYDLVPSTGRVICSGRGYALHHLEDCTHLEGGAQETWRFYDDPDGLTWRRLIDSAPSADRQSRREFAAKAGLLNGQGAPITSTCESCLLKPISGTRILPLDEAFAQFDRTSVADRVAQAKDDIERTQRDFPRDGWTSMPLERYALGVDDYKNAFCYRLEFGTRAIASITGGSARKHLIFLQKKDKTWYHDAAYSNEQAAWAAVRQGFVDAFNAVEAGNLQAVDEIDALRSGASVAAKACYVYFPHRLLPIFGKDHVHHFIRLLSDHDPKHLGRFAAIELLKKITDDTGLFTGWHTLEIARFLYWWSDPRQGFAMVKISPGKEGVHWEECLAGGYICVGWDEIGDLTAFTSEEDFMDTFRVVYANVYGNQSKMTAKARELWRLTQLKPGDRVIANRGTHEVLGLGTVTDPGYIWNDERAEQRHTVTVDWDTSYAQTLPEPEKRWGMVTVADVPQRLWRAILSNDRTAPEIEPTTMPVPITIEDPYLTKLADALERKGQAVLYGPPGTGKTYTSLRFAVWWLSTRLGHGLSPADTDYGSAEFRATLDRLATRQGRAAAYLTQVTFHPAYGYEDFIEGFRPIDDGTAGLRLSLVDGVFKRICRTAEQDPGNPYLLLIDEINRGDMPKIFGELITLLERDKRGLTLILPQSGQEFRVPQNVYVLGTMNTADRSIRLLDSALRRRFSFVELLPDTSVLEGFHVGKVHLADLLRELNLRVLRELGRERQIGHSFFLTGGSPINDETVLGAVIRDEILPLLQEYAYDDFSMLARFLGADIVDVVGHRLHDLNDDELLDALYAELQVDASQR